MKDSKVVLQFICYTPCIYSGFDKFNVLLAQKLVEQGFLPVFVFYDSVNQVPAIESDLKSAGAVIELISSNGLINNIISTRRLFRKYKPVIVHTHFVNIVKIVTAFFSLLNRGIFFVTFHSSIFADSARKYKKEKGIIKRTLLFLYYRFILICSHNVFTVSDAIKNQFLDFASSHSPKVQKLYLGVSLKRNESKKSERRSLLGLPNDKVILCNISAFEYIKGLDILCKALALLKSNYKLTNFCFCHIGGLREDNLSNQSYKKSIIFLSNDLQIQDEVVWMGNRNDIPDILSAFDIYVHPSRMEGLGFANIEASVQKLPIIGSNIGGIPEIVRDCQNGFLFKPEDVEHLAECLYKLISDESLRKKMGENSYSIVSENFNIEVQTGKLANYYFQSIL